MANKTRAAVVLPVVGAMLLIGSPAMALGWTTVPSPSEVPGDNYLYGADSSGPADVWAVGSASGTGPSTPLALHWTGSSWTRETTPTSSNPFLTGAAAAGPGAVWATGYRFELHAYANRTLTMLGS